MNLFFQPELPSDAEAKLINAIYDAAVYSQLWPKVLAEISDFCCVDQCTLFYYDGIERQRNYAAAAKVKVETLDLYLDEFIAPQSAQLNNQLSCLPEGKVVTDADIHCFTGKTYAQIVGLKYMQCVWPKLHFQAGTVLFRSTKGSAGLGLQNFVGSAPINAENIERLQRLTPHLIQAIHIRQRINLLERANHAFQAVLQHLRLGVVLLNANEEVTFINREASRSFAKCPEIHYQPNQRMHFFSANAYRDFNCSNTSRSKHKKYEKRKIAGKDNYLKIVYPHGHLKISLFLLNTDCYGNYAQQMEQRLPSSPHFLVLVQDSQRPCELPIEYLKQAYGITPAESELISHMLDGATLVEAAEKRDITHETARWQMKNIMQKTQVHSQHHLTQLMLSLIDG